jgi:hypothetical protein
MNKEINKSPLVLIENYLNKEIYDNIIEQSQNPNDKLLHKNYKKIIRDIKHRQIESKINKIDESLNTTNSNNINKVSNDFQLYENTEGNYINKPLLSN